MSLAIWNKVEKTDPAHTKSFSRGGGFSGTAINSTYLIRKATELWGPMGVQWGLRVVDEQYIKGAPILIEDQVVAHETIHVLRGELWFPDGDKTGLVQHYGQTTFVGQNKRGVFTDEEAPKKSLTDCLSKCLSMLGFGADVFLGMFDDNKYVNQVKAEFEKAKAPAVPATRIAECHATLKAAKNLNELAEAFVRLTTDEKKACTELKEALKAKLSEVA